MFLKLVENLREAMQVRTLRNSCREYLTNNRDHIGILQQLRWYFGYYCPARRTARYRLYVLLSKERSPLGYGALALRDEKLFVTECVAPGHRGEGYGRIILRYLTKIAAREQRDLVAEIWVSNNPSIALHEREGFTLRSRSIQSGSELYTYELDWRALAKTSAD